MKVDCAAMRSFSLYHFEYLECCGQRRSAGGTIFAGGADQKHKAIVRDLAPENTIQLNLYKLNASQGPPGFVTSERRARLLAATLLCQQNFHSAFEFLERLEEAQEGK